MKNILITCTTIIAVLAAANVRAQSWTNSGSNIITDAATNNVGIGDNAPVDKLTVNGNISFTGGPGPRAVRGLSDMYLEIYGKHNFSNGAGMVLGANDAPGYDGLVRFVSGGNSSSTAAAMDLLQYNGGAFNGLFTIRKNGEFNLSNTLSWYPSPTNRRISARSDMYLEMYGRNDFSDGAGMVLGANGAAGYDGLIRFVSGGGSSLSTAFQVLQHNGGAYNSLLNIKKNGDFDINGTLGWQPSATNRRIAGRTSMYTEMYGNNTFADGAGMVLGANGASGYDGLIRFVSGGGSSSASAFDILQYNGGAFTPLMYVRKDGKVVIGNVTPNTWGYDYKLYVDNGIMTERVRVAVPGTGEWSDFVFDADYKLMPLNEVENYINENKHLPEIPSAGEVVKDGIDVATMDAKLLQKIEELTLYVIKQQKEIDNLKKQIKKTN